MIPRYRQRPAVAVRRVGQPETTHAIYLHCIYAEPTVRQDFEDEYAASGQPMDIGKSCARFIRPERLPLDVIERAVRRMSVEEHITVYEASRRRS